MLAAVMHNIGEDLKVEKVPDPTVPEGWALVKVRAAGVCGTELHFLEGLLSSGKSSFILGHEIAGDVMEAPQGSGFKKGDRVSVYNLMNCGKCSYCREGRDELCSNVAGQIGFTQDGGFAEYVAVPVGSLVSLPDEVPYTHGAVLACSGMTAMHAVRLAGVGLTETVVIDGVGGVGLIVGQVAKLAGARVLAIADSEEKAALACKVFADDVIITKDYSNVPDDIKKKTGGKGVDAFFELVGTSASTTAGLNSLAKKGRFMIIGYTKDRIDVDPLWMVIGELKLMASVAGAKKDLEDILQLAKEGKIKVTIQSEMKLDSINEAISRLKNRTSLGRNVICF